MTARSVLGSVPTTLPLNSRLSYRIDLDLVSALDHVIVRQDIPVLGHDNAGAKGGRFVLALLSRAVELVSEEAAEKGIIEHVS